MIVEVTGPSGVGKSSFIDQTVRHLTKNGIKTGAIHSAKLNNCLTIPRVFSELESHNVMTDIMALPWSILFAVRNLQFSSWVLKRIFYLDESLHVKVAILRSFIRKSGIRCFLNRKKYAGTVIIVDEGLFHCAHNFLCSPSRCASDKEIRLFFDLCPKPDKLIMLKADKEILLERLNKRGDLSPRISDITSLEGFVSNSYLLFTKLETLLVKNEVGISLGTNNCLQSKISKAGINYIVGSNSKN